MVKLISEYVEIIRMAEGIDPIAIKKEMIQRAACVMGPYIGF
jgi:hypothetical protein